MNQVIAHWGRKSLHMAPVKKTEKHAFLLIPPVQHSKVASGLLSCLCISTLSYSEKYRFHYSVIFSVIADCLNQLIFSLYHSPMSPSPSPTMSRPRSSAPTDSLLLAAPSLLTLHLLGPCTSSSRCAKGREENGKNREENGRGKEVNGKGKERKRKERV